MEVSGQHHAPAALYPRGKDPRYPLYRRLGGPPEPVWTLRLEEKSSAPAEDRTLVEYVGETLINLYEEVFLFYVPLQILCLFRV
jgi:hypothetical protein